MPQLSASQVATQAIAFDTVPWNSFAVLSLTKGKPDHKRAYMPIFWLSLVVLILISLPGVFLI